VRTVRQAIMDSPASLPADVLAAIAKQRGKNKAPTMTAGEIAKHRSGNAKANNIWGVIVRPGAPGWGDVGPHGVRVRLRPPLSHPLLRARLVT
jgi:hypothetical protein